MKRRMLVLGFLLAAVGLRADGGVPYSASPATDGSDGGPRWFLNGDGLIGARIEPAAQAGHAVAGLGAGLEYVPGYLQHLGLDADYDYLAESRNPLDRDNDLDLSLRLFTPNRGALLGWLQAGAGYNTTPNPVNGRFLAFVGPGLRWFVAPRLAFDAGIQYTSQTPEKAFVQSVGLKLGLSIPLDASFIPERAQAAPVPEPSPTPEPTPAATPEPAPAAPPTPTPVTTSAPAARAAAAFGRIYLYRVRKGEDLWTIAGKTLGDPALWPLLRKDKGALVANPNSIYVGEKLRYRGAYTIKEIARAVKKAAAFPTPGKDMPVP